jgi:hypothetical protein
MAQPISLETWKQGPTDWRPEFLATIARTAAVLDAELHLGFEDDVEDGLGRVRYAPCVTTTGRKFVLAQYPDGPTPGRDHTTIMVKDADCGVTPLGEILDEIVTELRLRTTDLPWVHPQVTFRRHALWRQDDNGNRYEVGVYTSCAEATHALRELESHHHRQFYWVVRV